MYPKQRQHGIHWTTAGLLIKGRNTSCRYLLKDWFLPGSNWFAKTEPSNTAPSTTGILTVVSESDIRLFKDIVWYFYK